MFFTERRHSEPSALGLTGSYDSVVTGLKHLPCIFTPCYSRFKIRTEVLKIRQESWFFYWQILDPVRPHSFFAANATKFSRFTILIPTGVFHPDIVCITKREKAESEAQRGKPKGTLESEIRNAIV